MSSNNVHLPNEVLADISDFAPNYYLADLTFLTRSFSDATAHRLRFINEKLSNMSTENVVLVTEKENTNQRIAPLRHPVELPLETDKTLGWHTLIGAFPNASGLKYRNQATSCYRALLVDPTGFKFMPPDDGWKGKTFIVISVGSNEPAEETIYDKPRWADRVKRWIYEEVCNNGSGTGRCFTIIATNYAASFAHGTHNELIVGVSTLKIRRVHERENAEVRTVKVVHIDPTRDFILVHCDGLSDTGPDRGPIYNSTEYLLVGLSNRSSRSYNLTHFVGVIQSYKMNKHGQVIGTTQTINGDSGGAVFNKECELLGIAIGVQNLPLNTRPLLPDWQAFSDASKHVPATFIVNAYYFYPPMEAYEKSLAPEERMKEEDIPVFVP
ncbi:tar DNA-binding protein like protein 1 [Ditylenchus destructor]|uniref:Tar DNA-binding protein like protein 1 n=1 Tax=Ditylenchus destructor TaxID=166010 RepID=A0AAD4MN70_9BILA|nr:tar DNA-binding protein like protein 1 [Ditylenchus destructor]